MRKTLLIIAAIVAASLAVATWLGQAIPQSGSLALGLALAAVGISAFGVYKDALLEFTPEVLARDVIVPRPIRSVPDVKLLLPLQFTNSGAADGIIECVAPRLTHYCYI